MLDQLTYYVEIGAYILIGVAAVVTAVLLVFFKRKRTESETERPELWAGLRREDTKTYVPCEAVKDEMLVMDGGRRFVMAILCRGNDFYDFAIEEQCVIADGYLGFVNTIDKRITKRTVSRPMNLEEMVSNHKEAFERKNRELEKLYLDVASLYRECKNETDKDRQKAYTDEIVRVEHLIETVEWKRKHLSHELLYLDMFDGANALPVAEDYYMIEWVPDSTSLPAKVTPEEIMRKARVELGALAAQKISALSMAKVPARIATTAELEEIVRRHFRPVSAEIFRTADIEKSNVKGDIADADESIEKLRKEYERVRAESGIKQKATETDSREDLDNEEVLFFEEREENEDGDMDEEIEWNGEGKD